MKQAIYELNVIESMFGFYMDAPENGIGSTGWDMIKGDLTAGLYK